MIKTRLIVIVVACLVVLGIILAGIFGTYPVASVNGKLVHAGELEKLYRASLIYQNNLIVYYNQQSSSTALQAPPDSEVERSVLNQLVESRLIDAELRHGHEPEVLKTLISGKLDQYTPSDLEKQATLFGLSLDEYINHVLTPQTEHDLLWNSLFIQGKDANGWLAQAKADARVTLFSFTWKWDGKEVVAR